MTLRSLRLTMTPAERRMGRFMRAPDHGTGSVAVGEDADDGIDNDEDEDDNDNQSVDTDGSESDREDDNEESDTSEDDDSEGERKPRNGYEKRIATLTRRLRESEARNSEKRETPAKDDAKPQGKPKVSDFDNYEDFIEALADFKAEEKFTSLRERDKAASTEKDFTRKYASGMKKFADWDEVVTDDVQISKTAVSALKETDDPAAIVYNLGKLPSSELDKFNDLSPAKQALYIGRMEAKLEKGSKGNESSERRTSKAPEPISPTRERGGKIEKDPDKMSFAEYDAFRRQQIARGSK